MQSVIFAPAKRPLLRPAPVPPAQASGAPAWGFPEWFIISQTLIPALLSLPGSNAFRLPIRIAPFAISLLGFLYLPVKSADPTTAHPARRWLLWALAYLAAMVFHPTTNSFLSGAAQVMLYLCVMAP